MNVFYRETGHSSNSRVSIDGSCSKGHNNYASLGVNKVKNVNSWYTLQVEWNRTSTTSTIWRTHSSRNEMIVLLFSMYYRGRPRSSQRAREDAPAGRLLDGLSSLDYSLTTGALDVFTPVSIVVAYIQIVSMAVFLMSHYKLQNCVCVRLFGLEKCLCGSFWAFVGIRQMCCRLNCAVSLFCHLSRPRRRWSPILLT